MNTIVYHIAEGIARRDPIALGATATLEGYTKEIKLAVEKDEFPENKYDLTDTYAYAELVIEATQSNPDRDKIKKLVKTFEIVVDNSRKTIGPQATRLDRTNQRIFASHLASARELAND
jgi:hypothetical protein